MKRWSVAALAVVAFFTLSACGSADPFGDSTAGGSGSGGSSEVIVIGSQDYYSNEIIAEIYAQALEDAGYQVRRDFRIGPREIYLPELQAGEIDVFPEYTGNLLQYLNPEAEGTDPEAVHTELIEALPNSLAALDAAEATDQDSYVITEAFSAAHGGITSIGDLAGIDGLVLGGSSELETRPYGPEGLQEYYGVTVAFAPIEDSGGPLTVKALNDGTVQLANIYSANPVLDSDDLIVLADPEALFVSSNVVPIVSSELDDGAAAVLNAVNAKLDTAALVAMNAQSKDEGAPAAKIAAEWLRSVGLVGE